VRNELLEEVKARGMEEALHFISDGLAVIVDAITQVYPHAKYQLHVARNIAPRVRVSHSASICNDFKTVYRAEDEQAGRVALEDFSNKWKSSYPKVVK